MSAHWFPKSLVPPCKTGTGFESLDLSPKIHSCSCMTWVLECFTFLTALYGDAAYRTLAISMHPRGLGVTFWHIYIASLFIFKRRVVARLKWVCCPDLSEDSVQLLWITEPWACDLKLILFLSASWEDFVAWGSHTALVLERDCSISPAWGCGPVGLVFFCCCWQYVVLLLHVSVGGWRTSPSSQVVPADRVSGIFGCFSCEDS